MCIFLRISGFAWLSTKGQMTGFVLDAEARKAKQKYTVHSSRRSTVNKQNIVTQCTAPGKDNPTPPQLLDN
jgi:hypothetical protein